MTTLSDLAILQRRAAEDAPTQGGWCAAYAQDVGVLLALVTTLTTENAKLREVATDPE